MIQDLVSLPRVAPQMERVATQVTGPAQAEATAGQPQQRLILLLGSPRSGTTWFANILSSHRQVLYSHEPLSKLESPSLQPLLRQLKTTGTLQPGQRAQIMAEWCRAHHDIQRPPFFAKDFTPIPPSLMWLGWSLVHILKTGAAPFRSLFSPRPGTQYDLLVKEVGWGAHARALVHAFNPELLVIFRHPYAVVASVLKGKKRGFLPDTDRLLWFRYWEQICQPLGISRSAVLAMEECEFFALKWLTENTLYSDILQEYPRSLPIVYEELCTDPHGVTATAFRFLDWTLGSQTARFLEDSTALSQRPSLFSAKKSYFGIQRDSTRSAQLWREALPEHERAKVAAFLRPFPLPFWQGQEPWG